MEKYKYDLYKMFKQYGNTPISIKNQKCNAWALKKKYQYITKNYYLVSLIK